MAALADWVEQFVDRLPNTRIMQFVAANILVPYWACARR